MKLKTLKDIKEQDWSTHKEDMELVGAVFYELKAEAVKWVKRHQVMAIETHMVEDWIKHFFNITEDDLK